MTALDPGLIEAIQTAVHDAVTRVNDRLLKRPEVESMTGLSRSEIYRLKELGLFPQPYRITKKAVAWKQSEVQAWINERKQAA